MSENKPTTCKKCGTPMVPSKETIKLDGMLPLDGTWNLDNQVCPKCHPDLAESNQ